MYGSVTRQRCPAMLLNLSNHKTRSDVVHSLVSQGTLSSILGTCVASTVDILLAIEYLLYSSLLQQKITPVSSMDTPV